MPFERVVARRSAPASSERRGGIVLEYVAGAVSLALAGVVVSEMLGATELV